MSTRTGLWIDHAKAVIVKITEDGETTDHVTSNVGGHAGYSARSSAANSHEGVGEASYERKFEGELNRYYDEVITRLRDADAVMLFGPGEAKLQLKARMEHAGLGGRIAGVETTDKLTDRQIAAHVRAHVPQ